MNTITVKTQGGRISGHWYDAGTYSPPIQTDFQGPAYYWLEPTADKPHGDRWFEKGISLGECNTQEQLDSSIDAAIRERGEMTDPNWLLGATTEISMVVKKFDR